MGYKYLCPYQAIFVYQVLCLTEQNNEELTKLDLPYAIFNS